MDAALTPEKEVLHPSSVDSDIMILDAQTTKDLEIFDAEGEGKSLFQFCNLTRTEGGARALRRRMEHPWCNAARIAATQESITFILAQRQAFTNLPSAFLAARAEHYADEIMPSVAEQNAVEFGLGALSLWANNNRHYSAILYGVQVSCKLIVALRSFAKQAELASPVGELAPLLEEMNALLDLPRLLQISDGDVGRWAWKILRLDQVFRLHEKVTVVRLLQLVCEIDALVAMADATDKNGFLMPTIESGALRVHAQGLVHPFVHNAVANPVELSQQRRVLFLTGPNMAGKTTYLRAFATACYFAHLGMGVPASQFGFVPAQRLFSSLSLSDDLSSGISYFRAEALRVKAVAQAIAEGYRVVAIMDEPFKGTNVKDAFDASLAVLERFAAKQDCLFMFSSHLIELSEQLGITDEIDCRNFEAEEGEGRLRFDYLLRSGVSTQRLGMRVLHEEGVFDLLDGNSKEESSGY